MPVRLLYVATRRTDDDADAKNLQLMVTIDGISDGGTDLGHNDNTWYYHWLYPLTDNYMSYGVNVQNVGYYEDLRGLDVRVEVRQTGAPGANAELDCRVQYEVLRRGGIYR